jgi:hypothetical protein
MTHTYSTEKLKIRIGGIPYTITKVETNTEVCHDGSGEALFGQINYGGNSIRILKSCPERELRIMLHEILHGIISEYQVRELMRANNDHIERPIDQLALGLAEVFESLGITELKPASLPRCGGMCTGEVKE